MGLNKMTSDFDGFSGYGVMNFLSPPSVFASDQPSPSDKIELRINTEVGFQIRSPLIEENKITKASNTVNEVFDEKSLSLKLVGEEETEEIKSPAAMKSTSGHIKLCVRGHWRPAEDAMLKELVTQYGPQNWNLIAEHLQGRSGTSFKIHSKKKEPKFYIFLYLDRSKWTVHIIKAKLKKKSPNNNYGP